MYLARKRKQQKIHYMLRESVPDGHRFKSRDLVDLGDDPGDYIVYPEDGQAFYFDENLCRTLEKKGVAPDNEQLEQVFWPFLDPESRRVIEGFGRPAAGRKARRQEQARRCQIQPFHLFDRRRIHFLRFGEMDQSRLGRAPKKIYRPLLDKSRDEIEQQFWQMEEVLQNHEKKNYVFTIFNVAGHFASPIARQLPQALPAEKVDAYFLDAVCHLNADDTFWWDLPLTDTLHEYLVRYVCWFFDSEFAGGHYLEDLLWQFKRRHHGYRPPPRQDMAVQEALQMLDLAGQDPGTLTVRQLTRQYRRLAKQHHPDQQGQHESFIRLQEAFEQLLQRIKTNGRGQR